MIYICDDYEQVLKLNEQSKQTLKDRINSLTQEDRQFFSIYFEVKDRNLQLQDYIPTQILNQYSQARLVIQQQFQRNLRNQQSIQIQIESIEESNSSDTQSLSFISDQQYSNLYDEQQQWQQILNQNGNLFKEYANDILFKTDKCLNHFYNQNKYVQQNQSNKVYLGLLLKTNEQIVIKEQEIQNESLIDAAQQFVIHDQIYQLYPTIFLKQYLPVQIKIDYEKFKFISMSEQGLTDLYQYSQQKLIKDLELQLIFSQILKQIQLLHKHNIAHRDIKPQNIIYVENKGWVLCDFENSLKYNEINGVYDIKGTFAFLIPQIQINSRINGIQMKQNLLKNDLYALAITMIVIKYQIKSQEELQQYLNKPQDPIIDVLLKAASLEDLQQYACKYEIRFIRPQYKEQQSDQQLQNSKNQEITEFLILVGKLTQSQLITNECKIKYLDLIDEILKQYEYLNYYHIVCYQDMPQYVDQLKNLIKYKELRQRKYWKNMFQRLFLRKNQDMIQNTLIFMQQIGLIDLFLHYAQQYIKINYDFSIHIMIIDLLDKYRGYEEVQYQFDLLLKHRDFYQMNQKEQQLFIEYTTKGYFQQLKENEVNYFQSIGIKFSYHNSYEFLLNHYYDDLFLEQIVCYIEKLIKNKKPLLQNRLNDVWDLADDIILLKPLQVSLKLLEIIKQKVKFQSKTIDWQVLIGKIIHFNDLLRQNNKKQIKILNYVIIFNSESCLQQDTLKFVKYSIQLYQSAKKKSFRPKIIHKIIQQIRNLSKCQSKYYQFIILRELLQLILDNFYQKLLFEIFIILVYVSKNQELLGMFTPYSQDEFFQSIIVCYNYTKNIKRLKKLVTKDELFNILNFRKHAKIIIPSLKNNVLYKQYQIMKEDFHLNQYLYR